MKPASRLLALLACAGALANVPCSAQTTGTAASCPAASDTSALQLYGLWQASFDDGTTATLRLERHPEFAQSLSGSSARADARSRLAGDIDQGLLSLEESRDGRSISAVWNGHVVEGGCGREIRGQWRDSASGSTQEFVLRKTPGWQ